MVNDVYETILKTPWLTHRGYHRLVEKDHSSIRSRLKKLETLVDIDYFLACSQTLRRKCLSGDNGGKRNE